MRSFPVLGPSDALNPGGTLPSFHAPDWVLPSGVARLGPEWFAPQEDVDEDLILDAWPFDGKQRARDHRLPHERILDRWEGIVATHELLAAGFDEWSIRFHVDRQRLVRLRKGWYGHPQLPVDAALSWRIGGPLACVSALVHHGLRDPAETLDALHVAVRANTSRRPSALSITGYVGAPRDRGQRIRIVRHWSTTAHRSGSRLAVSPAVALEQARLCRAPGA